MFAKLPKAATADEIAQADRMKQLVPPGIEHAYKRGVVLTLAPTSEALFPAFIRFFLYPV